MLIMALCIFPALFLSQTPPCAGTEPSLTMPVPISGVWSPIIFGEAQKYFSSCQQHSCCPIAWDPSCSFSQDWFGAAGIDLFCRAFPQPLKVSGPVQDMQRYLYAEIFTYPKFPLIFLFCFKVWKLFELELFLTRAQLLENQIYLQEKPWILLVPVFPGSVLLT